MPCLIAAIIHNWTCIVIMERKMISKELGIAFPLEAFQRPPCKPPKGKEVIERMCCIVKTKTNISTSTAAFYVANEIMQVWTFRDGRIPLLSKKTVQKKVLSIYESFAFLRMDCRKTKKNYSEKVCGFWICFYWFNVIP